MTDYKYQHTVVMGEPQGVQAPQHDPIQEPWTCQYVLTLLVNVFCACIPCAVIGTIHLMAARADYVRGYMFLAEKKKRAATAWTVAAFVLGVVGVVIYIIILIVAAAAVSNAAKESSSYYG